ncbi:MAG: AAA family ATPase [Phycisphaera sp.]|nr:AAA family ATPase [Phycisphaera sp.]
MTDPDKNERWTAGEGALAGTGRVTFKDERTALRTIAIINQKGGCGKTTVSINLSAVLAKLGHKTLLVDVDPQSHCSLGLAVPETQIDKSIGDMLMAGLNGTLAFPDIVWQIARNFDLAPSTMSLAGVEHELATVSDKDRRLVQVLSTVAADYDFCVIDCPPSIGLLTFNALRAAEEVIIPVETGYFALQGAVRQEATIEMLARRAGHHTRFRVLATMYDVRTKLAREILSEMRRHFADQLLPVVVNFNSKLKEAASFGQPITEYDAASRGMQDFDKLAAWLISNPPTPASSSPDAPPATTTNPAMTRAAELVERARALSARTAALSAKLASDPDMLAEPSLLPPMEVEESDDDKRDGKPTPQAPRPLEPVVSRLPSVSPRPSDRASILEIESPTQRAHPADESDVDHHESPGGTVTRTRASRLFGVRATSQGLLFVQPIGKAITMAIASEFNNWDPTQTPMKRDDELGVWQTCVAVPPGRYRYRIVVDGRWMQDPHNRYVESNPFGELNNIVEYGIE